MNCVISRCIHPASIAVRFRVYGPEFFYCVIHDARHDGPHRLRARGWQPWQMASVRFLD